jgi:hypothetical protein
MMQNPGGGYGQAPGGGYAQAPAGGYGQPQQGGFGGAPAGQGGAYQVLTIDTGCFSGTIDHNRISELANQMAAQGYTLDKLFIDIRSVFGPFCPKRCAVLVFKRG